MSKATRFVNAHAVQGIHKKSIGASAPYSDFDDVADVVEDVMETLRKRKIPLETAMVLISFSSTPAYADDNTRIPTKKVKK